jgi:hypothetical protein
MKRGTRNDVRGVRAAEVLTDLAPIDALDIPPFPDSDQFNYRWLRVKVGADDDIKNINSRLREGWTFVKEEDIPEDVRSIYILPVIKAGLAVLNGVVQNGDLALGKIERDKAEALMEVARAATARQMMAVDARLIDFEDVGGSRHRFRNDSTSRVRVGKTSHLDA